MNNYPISTNPFPMDGNGNPVAVMYGIVPDTRVPGMTDTYIPVHVTTSGAASSHVTQNVIADSNNSSTTNLPGGSTFFGRATSTLGVAGIQVSLKTDQNCTVHVDQSPDGTNWDISDPFHYYSAINNFGTTVQAINSYERVRVTNLNALSDTSYFRLQTALCPVVEPLPRSLSASGNLLTEVAELRDSYGFSVENTPMGEMRTATPFRLVGSTYDGLTTDTRFWTAITGNGGTAVTSNAQLVLSSGTVANNSTSVQSVRTARYLGGSANRFRMVMRLPDTGTTNNVRRWGAFTPTDGAFFELDGTLPRVVTRKGSVDTQVNNWSFNGDYGDRITVDTNVHTYEIYWTNSKVWFVYDDTVVHTFRALTSTWSNTMNLPVRFENNSKNGGTSNVGLNVRVATIYRLGQGNTQPTSFFQSGQVAAAVLKIGAGNLHEIVISNVSNTSAITLYDGTTTGGNVIWASGAMGAQTIPFSVDFKGLPFFQGLTLAIATANSNATVVYE